MKFFSSSNAFVLDLKFRGLNDSRDIRNRIEALFVVDNASSWKCLTTDYALVSPLNEKARKIYDLVSNELEDQECYECSSFFNAYCAPPYGLSEEAAAMFLAQIIANLWHNVRVEYQGTGKTVSEWKDSVVEDKKIHLDVFKTTTLLWVDIGSVEAKFQQLFKKINDNRNINEAKRQRNELQSLIELYGLPEQLEVYNRLATMRFSQFDNAEKMWDTRIGDIEEELDAAEERGDVYKALNTIEMVQSVSVTGIFGKNDIDVSDEYNKELDSLSTRADVIIHH